ncbi:MAG: class II glutamine amidotransferase [Parvibaculaceae bacterium]
MCELFAMSANEPVRVRYDLNRFAAEGGERHQNRDGWGVVFSDGADAHYFREALPASDSPLDRFVREHALPHESMIAHVRRASKGGRTLENTHPFRRVHDGQVQHFAHNGTLHGIEKLPAANALLRHLIGETDSEPAFLLLLDRLEQAGLAKAGIAEKFDLFVGFCHDMAQLGTSNFLWLDGARLYVHADQRIYETADGLSRPQPPGLHMLRPAPNALGDKHECTSAKLENLPSHVILFASLPLSDAPWRPLEQGDVFAVSKGKVIRHGSSL